MLLCFPVLRLQDLLGVGNLPVSLAEVPRISSSPELLCSHSLCR